jgi:hypothetical protein
MKRYHLKRSGCLLFCTVMILGVSMLTGCGSGDTGATGATGPKGDKGDTGLSATATTDESCAVCHGAGKIADIAMEHPDDPAFLGAQVTISNIILTNTAGSGANDGLPVVSFHLAWADDLTSVTQINGSPLNVDMFRFIMADLVPAGTATAQWGTWATDYWERWVYERTPGSAGRPQGTLDVSDAANGNYTYTFQTEFGSAEALLDGPDYNVGHVQRLFIRFDGRADPNITQRAVGFLDFNIPAVGNQAVALDRQRQFVTAEACEKCHSPNWERAAHASGYRDIRACVLCHSPLGLDRFDTGAPINGDRGQFMQDNDTYASVFFHKIHGAIDIPFWRTPPEDRIRGDGYAAVTFPQHDANEELRDCVICHVDLTDDGMGGSELGSEAFQIDKWKTHPTAEICTSCHTNVDPIAGTNHAGGPQTNGACTVCHQSTGQWDVTAPIPAVHDITPRVAGTNGTSDPGYLPENIPEFDVMLTIDPPANGMYYDVGEEPEVRVTLEHYGTGVPVDPAVYTASQQIAGVTGGGLHEAYLQVYGPRAMAVPVLATDSTTDPNWINAGSVPGDIEDEHEMFFIGGTDPRVTTDSTGFGYKLLAIPANMKPGTYMVRVAFADYGRVGSGNYHIDSTAFMNIQIGTATVEPKVAGDACINCHGLGTAPFHDERHSVFFDTDQCLACHHDTGHTIGERVHGVPIANRVHAVHSANAEGDIYNYHVHEGEPVVATRDWVDVTFPREIQNCNTCHNSQYDVATNTFMGTYKTYPYMMPCSGCHVGASNDVQGDLPFTPNVLDHMRQNGGPW